MAEEGKGRRKEENVSFSSLFAKTLNLGIGCFKGQNSACEKRESKETITFSLFALIKQNNLAFSSAAVRRPSGWCDVFEHTVQHEGT